MHGGCSANLLLRPYIILAFPRNLWYVIMPCLQLIRTSPRYVGDCSRSENRSLLGVRRTSGCDKVRLAVVKTSLPTQPRSDFL